MDYDTLLLNERYSSKQIELLIRHAENELIVIDNADLVLPGTQMNEQYIREDTKNQYLLFSRGGYAYGADGTTIGRFICNNNTVTIQYLRGRL